MHRTLAIGPTALVTLAGLLAGCSSPAAPSAARAAADSQAEEQVRQTVATLQSALKARDADVVWGLLDDDSRADAERAARAVRDTYSRADAAGKAEQEKALGLSGGELAALTGVGFLTTKRFHGKYDELPESRVEKVVVQGETAMVSYVEPDGDKEKLTLTRQSGQWKVALPMPRAN